MKGLILLLAGLLFALSFAAEERTIKVEPPSAGVTKIKCDKGEWWLPGAISSSGSDTYDILHNEDKNEIFTCTEKGLGATKESEPKVFVRVRTCDNCIELDVWTFTAIIIGNILMTILIGVVVYKLTAQPTAKSFSGNKASDRQNLIQNGERDTYQPLNAGQKSEYSTLGAGKR